MEYYVHKPHLLGHNEVKTGPHPQAWHLLEWPSIDIALFPGRCHFRLHEEHGGPGIFSTVRDVKGRKVVERTNVGAPELRTARRAKVPSVELVVGWKNTQNLTFRSEIFCHLSITSCSCDQALPAFMYCKHWKAGQGLGNKATVDNLLILKAKHTQDMENSIIA